VGRNWFAAYESLMRAALRTCTDYPASPEEFVRLMEAAGIRFDALRDPWGSAMHVAVGYLQRLRVIKILSAGPDRAFGTADDFTVAEFSGSYFSAIEARIDRILNAAPEFPGTAEAFRGMLSESGVDLDSLKDPWGRGYYLAFRDDESFANQVQLYTYAEYSGVPEDRKQITPVKRTQRTAEIRSVGEDGLKGTYDDFAVATFLRVLRTPQAPAQPKIEDNTTLAVTPGGTGTIAGEVTDPSGAVAPNVEVKLELKLFDVYVTRTNACCGPREFFSTISLV